MSFENPGFEKKQGPIPTPDLHAAICYAVIDLGKQKEQFPGKPEQIVSKCQFCWEFTNLPHAVFDEAKGPQPMAVFQEYTIAAGDRAKLPKMLASWGRMAAPQSISSALMKMFLGQACAIQVEHNPSKKDKDSKTGQPIMYANVGQKGLSVMPWPASFGHKPTQSVNKPIFFSLDHFTWEQYDALPKGIQKKISECMEWPQILASHPRPAGSGQTQQSAAFNAQPPVQQQSFEQNSGISTPAAGGPSF